MVIHPVEGAGPEGFDVIAITGRAYGRVKVIQAGPETHLAVSGATLCRDRFPGYPEQEDGTLAQVTCPECTYYMLKRMLRKTWVILPESANEPSVLYTVFDTTGIRSQIGQFPEARKTSRQNPACWR